MDKEKIREEVENMEKHMLELESNHNSYAFSGSEMLEKQLKINQCLLKIIKQLTDHPKEKDWV